MTSSKPGHIRVGIGGWKFAPWRETFYPEKLTQKNELQYASRQMTAIEVNSTFYAAQRPTTYAKWRSETPDGFVFSLKAPGLITQTRTLANAKRGIQAFVFGGLAELVTGSARSRGNSHRTANSSATNSPRFSIFCRTI